MNSNKNVHPNSGADLRGGGGWTDPMGGVERQKERHMDRPNCKGSPNLYICWKSEVMCQQLW